ncbi:MAG: glycine dehydrogenase subunit 2 [bacterium]|nr:glycine dehydrogenase subunit 2 [bacterium]
MGMNLKTKIRKFHQAKWDEPVIFELSNPGERGILPPPLESEIEQSNARGIDALPESMIRKDKPALPELGQMQVLKHYLRLSQENLGADLNVDIGQGTCTMKYSPKINEQFARSEKITELHPYQDDSTVQGILEIYYTLGRYLSAISGLPEFSFQPGGGGHAILAMSSILQAYYAGKGELEQRDEIITTIFSHPSDVSAATVKGFKVITVPHTEEGLPDFEAILAAVSERTAAVFITNPEDTGIYNHQIKKITDLVHEHGGLCGYDQANANGILGITRALEAGFDMCFFNLHKTFSTPHGCGGPACGALGVTDVLSPYLPKPKVEFDGEKYFVNYDMPDSFGKLRSFMGVAPVVLKAFSWIRALGADGLVEASRVAVLNNNYVFTKLKKIRGFSAPFAEGRHRIEQVRYSLKELTDDTGVTTYDVTCRIADFGMHIWASHHPFIVPEPCTIEPTESYAKAELDEYIAVLEQISKEAYETPEIVKTAPHNSVISRPGHSTLDDPAKWAVTWRAYQKKKYNL